MGLGGFSETSYIMEFWRLSWKLRILEVFLKYLTAKPWRENIFKHINLNENIHTSNSDNQSVVVRFTTPKI